MTAEVYLWGTRIGVVAQADLGSLPQFNYDEKFLTSGIEIAPITMTLSKRIYTFPGLNEKTFYGLPGLLADSLPDKYGTKLIERYLEESGRNKEHFSSVERLCYVGNRGMGALEYIPAKGYTESPDMTIHVDALVKLASDILAERSSLRISAGNHTMEQIIKIGTSAGGARAKAVVAWNPITNDIRSGQIDAGSGYEYWLIKFDGVENNKDKEEQADGPEYTKIEYAYYLMAKAAGIEMSECRLYEESGRHHFMTKRFDREESTGKKIHMQSLGAMAHYDYNAPGVHSYEQAAAVIYKLGMGQKEIEQLFRRMVFNILSRNQDDHVKNISFLMNMRGIWSLAPAYDITFAYNPNSIWLSKHQMSMNGKLEAFTREDFYLCGKRMNMSKRKIEQIMDEVQNTISLWPKYADTVGLRQQTMLEIQALHRIEKSSK